MRRKANARINYQWNVWHALTEFAQSRSIAGSLTSPIGAAQAALEPLNSPFMDSCARCFEAVPRDR